VVALRKDSVLDHTTSVLALAVTALPEFVVAIGMIILFATVVWHVLPAVSLLAPGSYAWANPRELILPVATLVVVTVPYIIRMTRAAMVEALASDYVEMARLKGMPVRRVVVVHALPNAVAPVVQVLGLREMASQSIIENLYCVRNVLCRQQQFDPVQPTHPHIYSCEPDRRNIATAMSAASSPSDSHTSTFGPLLLGCVARAC